MIIKKETRLISYVETKPIKIPSVKIPVNYIKLTGIFVLLSLLFTVLTSVNEPIEPVTVQRFSPQEHKGIIEVCGLEQPKEYLGIVKSKEKNTSEKIIAITKIISNKKVLDFIDDSQVLERAFNVQKETGLSVATIIAQKGVESNWNNSSLCKKTKNYGNIKCFKKHNHSQVGCVKAYDKIEKSYAWYVRVNTNWEGWNVYKNLIYKRYMKAATQDDVRDQIVWLKKKGYATAYNYVELLWKTVVNNNLLELQKYIDEGYTITTTSGKYVLLQQ